MGKKLGKLLLEQDGSKALVAICPNGQTFYAYQDGERPFAFEYAEELIDKQCNNQPAGNDAFSNIESLAINSINGQNHTAVTCKNGGMFSVDDRRKKYSHFGEVTFNLAMSTFMADITCGLEDLPPPANTPQDTPIQAPAKRGLNKG